MRKILLLIGLIPFAISAQVGINNVAPLSTLDITAKTPAGTATTVDGLLVPRIDRQRAQVMTAIPTSTIIYVNDATTGAASGIAAEITAPGFYYFDGTKWTSVITTNNNNDWHLLGNTGTNQSTNFIGTTDNQNVVFRRNNVASGFLGTLNTSFGVGSLPQTSPAFFATAFGAGAMSVSTGLGGSAFGYQALTSNTTGAQNTAVGYQALRANTTGLQNTALGYGALTALAGGGGNVAVGHNSMSNSGLASGGFNVALGTNTLLGFTGGSANIAIGDGAGNTAPGDGGSTFTSGSRNIIIGNNRVLPNPTGDNQMNIGNAIFANNLSTNISTLTANVGIGTSTPTARLELASGTAGTSGLKFTNINNATPPTANTSPLEIDASGNVVVQSSLSTSFKSFNVDANSATNSLLTLGGIQLRYNSTTCTSTNTFVQIRSTTGANNIGIMHSTSTSSQAAASNVLIATTPLTITTTFTDITNIPVNCVQDGHAQFNYFSYTDKTFYRINFHVADGDSLPGAAAQGYIFAELQK